MSAATYDYVIGKVPSREHPQPGAGLTTIVRSPWALWTKHVRPVACIGGVNGNGMEQNELAPVGLSIFATQNYNLVTKEVLQDSCFLCAKLDLLDSIQIWLPGSKNVLIFRCCTQN